MTPHPGRGGKPGAGTCGSLSWRLGGSAPASPQRLRPTALPPAVPHRPGGKPPASATCPRWEEAPAAGGGGAEPGAEGGPAAWQCRARDPAGGGGGGRGVRRAPSLPRAEPPARCTARPPITAPPPGGGPISGAAPPPLPGEGRLGRGSAASAAASRPPPSRRRAERRGAPSLLRGGEGRGCSS